MSTRSAQGFSSSTSATRSGSIVPLPHHPKMRSYRPELCAEPQREPVPSKGFWLFILLTSKTCPILDATSLCAEAVCSTVAWLALFFASVTRVATASTSACLPQVAGLQSSPALWWRVQKPFTAIARCVYDTRALSSLSFVEHTLAVSSLLFRLRGAQYSMWTGCLWLLRTFESKCEERRQTTHTSAN